MADSRVKYSEAIQTAQALTLNNDDILTTAQEDAQSETGYVSKAFRLSTLANKIANGIDYTTELQTDSKKILGAINELKAQTGAFDITSEAEGTIATFNDGGDNLPVKNCTVQIEAVQAGSGTPSPTNVRTISGHNSVTVFKSGKNLIFTLHQSSASLILINATSAYTTTLKKGTYTFSATISKACSFNYRKSAGGTTVNIKSFTTTGNVSATFTIDEDLYNCNFFLYSSQGVSVSDISNAQLELNDEATTYEPYQGTTHTIALGQTVYGAELNITTGEGKEKKKYQEFDGTESWNRATNGAFYTSAFVDTTWQTEKISNMYPYGGEVGSSADVTEDKTFYAQYSQSAPQYCRLWIKDTDYTTVTDFTNFLSNNHLQLVYGLKTPTDLTTTPETGITTLAGENNIYADTGDIDVEYFNEQADDIAALFRLMTPAT